MTLPYTNRNSTPTAVPRERITARKWNDLARRVDTIGQVDLRGRQDLPPLHNQVRLQLFKFHSFPGGLEDYMICTVGTNLTQFLVAKPFALRPSLTTHGGVSFTYQSDTQRTADGSESQIIVPAYDVGDPIIAIGPIDTGVATGIGSGVVYWIDSNMAWGRGWAAEPPA